MPHRSAPNDELLTVELGPPQRELIVAHLLALPPDDRRLRFGATMTDGSIRKYVRTIRFDRDAAFGTVDTHGVLLGFAHLAVNRDGTELGISVLPAARHLGVAVRLLARAARRARNTGTQQMMMRFVPGNAALTRLAARAGMKFDVDADGPMAILTLPPAAPDGWLTEAIDEIVNALDLGFRLSDPASPP